MLNIQVLEVLGKEPVTLEEAKNYCRIDSDDIGDNELIKQLISSSISAIEMWANLSLIEKRIKVFSDASKTLWLPRSPIIEIESVTDVYENEIRYNKVPQEKIKINATEGFYVTYRAGYEALPHDLKLAILKQVLTDYDNRDNFVINSNSQQLNGTILSNSTKSLVRPYSRNLWI